MLTRSMLLERRSILVGNLLDAMEFINVTEGALQCIDELLEADSVPSAREALQKLGFMEAPIEEGRMGAI